MGGESGVGDRPHPQRLTILEEPMESLSDTETIEAWAIASIALHLPQCP
ncbi:MAG: hypothetical protein HC881_21115 [Leptolyngbyaceae cyanobacterium SL_7_1]|nr:hypothetical protein [Leptolyngbyaceae cyanobacterium SL_7_1]